MDNQKKVSIIEKIILNKSKKVQKNINIKKAPGINLITKEITTKRIS